ncbi:conserved Plasmodium protein, unknown function [Plasmodium ovale wallikeri]|uniref:Uncharacterized protein n=1 Tax=Plasmodium ovale wallikeri TaxID=864142 RepID=A0A1A8ZU40_PLAOA|nr:conserved Plasmodium protein, unknown function [Plasmodium ovale wallikeri]SBT52755.1 conserved Plasmodium protein, unknown function [Plasmodium ovale wallikeri]
MKHGSSNIQQHPVCVNIYAKHTVPKEETPNLGGYKDEKFNFKHSSFYCSNLQTFSCSLFTILFKTLIVKMEYLILEEKYKNLLKKSNYEKAILKKETEALQKKIESLEYAYIEKENKISGMIEEKEKLEEDLFEVKRENRNLKEDISRLNERIVDLTDVCKTYRRMIKSRNKELQQGEVLIEENINLRNSIEEVNNEKHHLELELAKKTKVISVIKDKYKKNIARLLEKFNEKDRHIQELQNFVLHELNNLKLHVLRENENVRHSKIKNIHFFLDELIKKVEEKLTISIMQ